MIAALVMIVSGGFFAIGFCVGRLWELEDPIDVPIGLEDIHELAGGRLQEPR